MCIAGLNRRAGHATDSSFAYFKRSLLVPPQKIALPYHILLMILLEEKTYIERQVERESAITRKAMRCHLGVHWKKLTAL